MAEQLRNQTDSQGRKQGYWEETDKSGYTAKGHYQDNLEQGYWKVYSPEGTLVGEGHQKNGMLNGHWKFYLESGELWREGSYKDGEESGIWKWYYKNGILYREEHYKEGKIHGFWKQYRPDGTTLESEAKYGQEDNALVFRYKEDGKIHKAYYERNPGEGTPLLQKELEFHNKLISKIGQKNGVNSLETHYNSYSSYATLISYKNNPLFPIS